MVAVVACEIRERVDLEEEDISDSVVLRFAKAAAVTVGLELGRTVDYLGCSEGEAEAIRNLAAVYCKCKAAGGSFSGLDFRVGDLAVDESSKETLQFLLSEAKRIIEQLKEPYVGSA